MFSPRAFIGAYRLRHDFRFRLPTTSTGRSQNRISARTAKIADGQQLGLDRSPAIGLCRAEMLEPSASVAEESARDSACSMNLGRRHDQEAEQQAAQRAAGDVAAGQQHAGAGFRLGLRGRHAAARGPSAQRSRPPMKIGVAVPRPRYMPTANGRRRDAHQFQRDGDQRADDDQAPFQLAAEDALDDRREQLRLRRRERASGASRPLSIFFDSRSIGMSVRYFSVPVVIDEVPAAARRPCTCSSLRTWTTRYSLSSVVRVRLADLLPRGVGRDRHRARREALGWCSACRRRSAPASCRR